MGISRPLPRLPRLGEAYAPRAQQALSVSVSVALQQQVEFVRLVDVETDAREFQDDERLAGLAHGLAVRQKTVVAEAQRDDVGRPPQHAVTAAPIVGWNKQRAFGGSGVENTIQVPRW